MGVDLLTGFPLNALSGFWLVSMADKIQASVATRPVP
jgi:hypothetical protein